MCKALFQKIAFQDRLQLIAADNISIFLNMVTLILSTGRDGQSSLTTIFQLLMKYLPLCDNSWLPLPYTTKLIQTHVLNPSNQFSLVSMLPIPSFTDINLDGHSFCSLSNLLQYIVLFNHKHGHTRIKNTHWMFLMSKHVVEYMNQILPNLHLHKPSVLCMTLFWMDGYDPNTSTKGNRKGAWAASRTFILYDIREKQIYYVVSTLFACGPGKGYDTKDHSTIFHQMVNNNKQLFNNDGSHKPISLISSYHNFSQLNFYICHLGALMDNPEGQTNFCLLGGNS